MAIIVTTDTTIEGTAGNDIIVGKGGLHTVHGNGGNDNVTTQNGNDVIVTLDGNDSITAKNGHNTIDAGDGNNVITAGTGNDTVVSGSGHDVISVGNGHNVIDSGDGHDNISAGTGNDTVHSGAGDDSVKLTGGNNSVDTGDGNDSVLTGSGNDSISTGAGNDIVNAGSGNNVIETGTGNDIVLAGSGIDHIETGDGNDIVDAGGGSDHVDLGAGNDVATGNGGNDTMRGGEGNDVMAGGSGTDTALYDNACDEYLIEVLDGQLRVVDMVPGNGDEGTDILGEFEYLNFGGDLINLAFLPENTVPAGPIVAAANVPEAIPGVSVDDKTGTTDDVTVVLSVEHGTLNVTAGAAAVQDNDTMTVTVSGTEADVNAALATLVYTAEENYDGPDTLRVSTTDADEDCVIVTDTVAIDVSGSIPSLLIGNASANEGGAMVFDLVLTEDPTETIVVSLETGGGSAEEGADYGTLDGVLVTFGPGTTSASVTVSTAEDTVYEGDESFTVSAVAVSGTVNTSDTGTGEIADNETPPTLTLQNASASEGDVGTTVMTFNLSLSGPSEGEIVVLLNTADGDATAGADYVALSDVPVTFASLATMATVDVTINGDAVFEGDETFTLSATSSSGPVSIGPDATGTIIDDDVAPTLDIGPASVVEGDSGATTMSFDLTLSNPSAEEIVVLVSTADDPGEAAAGTDYVALTNVPVTFAPGVTVATVDVTVNGDTVYEDDETFSLSASPSSGAVTIGTNGSGTIVNDDAVPSLSVGNASATEGGEVVFALTLSGTSEQDIVVEVNTSDGSAEAGTDYDALSGALVTFLAGATTAMVTVSTTEDDVYEPGGESFTIAATQSSGDVTVGGPGTGTIVDDGSAPTLSLGDASATEGQDVVFSLTLSNASNEQIVVDVSTADGDAEDGTDYTGLSSQPVTFAPGVTAASVTVATTDDGDEEANETFTLSASASSGTVTIGPDATGTIIDDDGNTAPILDDTPDLMLPGYGEDTVGTPTGAVGTLVSALVDLDTAVGGNDNVTDVDGDTPGIAITGISGIGGTWYYSIDNGANWNPFSGVTPAAALLLAPDARLFFTSAPDAFGEASIAFRAWDQTSGVNGGTADTTTNGGATAFSTATDTASLTVSPINDAPSVSLLDEPTFTEDVSGAVYVAPGGFVGDIDDTDLESMTITLANRPDGAAESLSLDATATTEASNEGLTVGAYNPATGVLTVTGTASLASYQTILRGLQYDNTSQDPDATDRTVSVVVNDGDTDSPVANATVTVVPTNDAPVTDLNGVAGGDDNAVTFSTAGGAVVLAADGTVTDVDDTDLESMTVTITNPLDGADESLSLDATAAAAAVGLSVVFAAGVLTVSGTASLATYQTILQGVVYDNAAATPDATDRVINVVMNDGDADSAVNTVTVSIQLGDPNDFDDRNSGTGTPTQFDDVIEGTDGNDTLSGGINGNDTIYGAAGNDSINGGSGSDTLYGGSGNDKIDGSFDNDLIYGGSGNDSLIAGAGNDTVFGGLGDDTIVGTSGTNTLYGDAGNDSITGGTQNDAIFGGDGNDTITDPSGNNTIDGGNGDDTITGGSQDDTITGGDGNDTITTGTGTNTVDGGAGNDTITGGSTVDRVSGGDDNDVINGGGGADTLSGDSGADTINGDAGTDTLFGGAGADTINGGSEADIIVGGADSDTVTGGTANDKFVLLTLADVLDTFTDFDSVGTLNGESDRILFDRTAFTGLSGAGGTVTAPVAINANEFESNATGAATTATARLIFNTTTNELSYDADGNGVGAAVVVAVLSGSSDDPVAADFGTFATF